MRVRPLLDDLFHWLAAYGLSLSASTCTPPQSCDSMCPFARHLRRHRSRA